jgi:hypothetical protein
VKITTTTVTTVELSDGTVNEMRTTTISEAGDNPRYGQRSVVWHLDRARQDHGVLWATAGEQPYHGVHRTVPSYPNGGPDGA